MIGRAARRVLPLAVCRRAGSGRTSHGPPETRRKTVPGASRRTSLCGESLGRPMRGTAAAVTRITRGQRENPTRWWSEGGERFLYTFAASPSPHGAHPEDATQDEA